MPNKEDVGKNKFKQSNLSNLMQIYEDRSKARQMRSKLNGTIQELVSKALDAYTREQENQDSLSCFQENQEIESWPNFAVRRDFKNQENQDFKSWKSWSKKPNLAAKAHWIDHESHSRF